MTVYEQGQPGADRAEATSLSNRVFEQLESGILEGRLAPGESLNELKLSALYGVSRTPVREAIRMLEQQNLVRLVPNKGAVVLGIDVKDLLDVYTIRSCIEGLASRWAAQRITPEKAKHLREIVDLQEFYFLKSNPEQIAEMDSRFHETIFVYSESRRLDHMLRNLHHMIMRYRKLSIMEEGRTEVAIAEHRLILEAICSGDGDEAERNTAIHINMARENLMLMLGEERNDI